MTVWSYGSLITDISTSLLGACPGEVEDRIEKSLARLGEFFHLDGIGIRWFDADRGTARLVSVWQRHAATTPPANVTRGQAPWIWPLMLRGDVVKIRRLTELPQEAELELRLLRGSETKSYLTIPLTVDGGVSGFLFAATVSEERGWAAEMVDDLRFAAEILAGGYARALAEASMRESEERYRRVVEDQTEFVVRWLPDGTRTFVNDSYCRYFRQPREALLGTSFFPLITEAFRDEVQARIDALTPEAPVSVGAHRVVSPDGEVAWQRWSDRAIFDENGKIVELQSVGRDVTAHKLAEAELKHRAEFQTLLADVSTRLLCVESAATDEEIQSVLGRISEHYGQDRATLWWFDDSGARSVLSHAWVRDIEHSGPRAIDVFGDTWVGKRLRAGKAVVVPHVAELPPEAERERAYLETHGISSGLVLPVELLGETVGACALSRFEGRRDWSGDEVQEVRVLASMVAHAFSSAQAAAALHRRETDLARAQRVASVGSFEYDVRIGKCELSSELQRILRLTAPVETPADYAMLVHPDDRGRFRAFVEQAARPDGHREIEYRCLLHDGTVIHARDVHEVDLDESGHVSRIFGTVADVTAYKKQEAELHRTLAELKTLKEQAEEEIYYLREEVPLAPGFESIVAESPAFRRSLHLAERVAPTDATVLVLGETGTGKELVARSIHQLSARKDRPLVTVNCAALPTNLIESELFGHEKGAFTGAMSLRRGRFELADGGTLFLDEIGDLPLELQSKLLRVLQEGEFQRLGGAEAIHVDVRIVAATNRDLEKAVECGEFRPDLYYRLNIFPISLPPMRERPEDIEPLAQHFIRKHAHRLGREIESISAQMLKRFQAYSWPGNVREFENTIERVLISSEGPILDAPFSPQSGSGDPRRERVTEDAEPLSLESAERAHILGVLDRAGWTIEGRAGAAAMLGIPASTLRSKMKKLGITRVRDAEASG